MNKTAKKIKLQDKAVANNTANEVKGGLNLNFTKIGPGGTPPPTAGLLLPAVNTAREAGR